MNNADIGVSVYMFVCVNMFSVFLSMYQRMEFLHFAVYFIVS